MAAMPANLLPYDCRAAFRQTILDFRLPQKHVVCDLLATETGRRAGNGEGQGKNNSAKA
jgi:hypothetical protein